MNILRLTYAPYALPFKKPLHTARGVIAARRGFIVAVHTDQGTGIGEVAPLPEFGTESFDIAQAMLNKLKQKAESRQQKLEVLATCPATRFGVESAMRGIEEDPKSEIRNPKERIAVNALIAGSSPEEMLKAAQEAVKAGYRTLKIKVGRRPVRDDIEIMRVLRAAFAEIRLRADANCAWSLDQARQFAHGVTGCALEYIEDPLDNPDLETLTVFGRNCEVPIACDDMARDAARKDDIIEHRLCDVIILKPSVMGSYATLEQMSRRAKARGIGVVITSLLETSVGLSYVAHCAAEYGTPELAHGLSTAELFERDTLTPPLFPQHGELLLPDLIEIPQRLTADVASQLSGLD